MSMRRARTLAVVTAAARPAKVVIIVVDALSKETVEKCDMRNVEALMKDGVDMGWTNEGYRDVHGLIGAPGAPSR
jgi:hypothetical protein